MSHKVLLLSANRCTAPDPVFPLGLTCLSAALREAGYAEILRRIRDEEPPRPSTRLSDSRDALPSIAAHRKTEPARLTVPRWSRPGNSCR